MEHFYDLPLHTPLYADLFISGMRSRIRGDSFSSCEHQEGSMKRDLWTKGWMSADFDIVHAARRKLLSTRDEPSSEPSNEPPAESAPFKVGDLVVPESTDSRVLSVLGFSKNTIYQVCHVKRTHLCGSGWRVFVIGGLERGCDAAHFKKVKFEK